MPVWICPNCGRTFSRQNQSHYCGQAPETIDAYIAAQPEAVQPRLQALRQTIRAALPEAQEKISWSMPTFWQECNIIHFANFKKYIGLYPGPEAVEAFSGQLADYPINKNTIQLPHDKPLPLELVAEIARWCLQHTDQP